MQDSNLDTLILTGDELEIARRQVHEMAYFKWLDAGSPTGNEINYWLEAERDWVAYNYVPHRYVDGERAEKRLIS